MKIGIFVGSLREASYSRSIANALLALPAATADYTIIPIGDLPLYNSDLETDTPPQQWTAFREKLSDLDAVLFVTPEYNRSLPAVLKNAIDVGSRPPGKSAWSGKAGAVISISMGALGGFGANHHLRQSMVFLDVAMMQQPEAYIGFVATLFDENRTLKEEATRTFLTKFLGSFEACVRVHSAGVR